MKKIIYRKKNTNIRHFMKIINKIYRKKEL